MAQHLKNYYQVNKDIKRKTYLLREREIAILWIILDFYCMATSPLVELPQYSFSRMIGVEGLS